MGDNVPKWGGRYPISPSLVRAVSGGLSSSCTTAMKMPPPGGMSTGSGGGREGGLGLGEVTLPPREGRGSHSPSSHGHLGKSWPAA